MLSGASKGNGTGALEQRALPGVWRVAIPGEGIRNLFAIESGFRQGIFDPA
jgi:hypothetical protein